MHEVPSPLTRKPCGGINANQLRVLAMFLMLLDHLWATLVPGNFWMTYLGRLAFPIFAFQISEGFFHTADRKRYAKRLFLFALLSEVPFDLIYGGTVLYPFHQNVMFTLLLGLLACCAIDRARRERTAKAILRGTLSVAGLFLLSLVGMVDYGWKGVVTVVAFYLLRDFPFAWLAQIAALVKEKCGDSFVTVTPGIRFADSAVGDQKRIMTPEKAGKSGCDYIVVGRPITQADDPVAAYRRAVKDFLG